MKYEVGDKVRIKSLDWYNQMLAIKDKHAHRTASNGCEFIGVWCGNRIFKNDMIKFCGQVMTIKAIENEYYIMHEDTSGYWYCDEMIEGPVEEKTLIERFDDNGLPFNEWLSHKGAFHIPDGYELKDENGNVINTHKIVLEKKKNEYPKTYEECCEILEDVADCSLSCFACGVLNNLQKLLLCRAAYWKLYGEEMGLGKPWENSKYEVVYSICREEGDIVKRDDCWGATHLFEFPIREMRDAFKENFYPDIEICKEFL